jgi:hypothetical protein
MKKILLLLIIIFPSIVSSQTVIDSLTVKQIQILQRIDNYEKGIEELKLELSNLKSQSDYLANLNETTINCISTQLDSATYNLTLFGILFAIIAVFFGVYITYIEKRVVKLREENKSLLEQTIKNKDEVVAINNLIQKDIYGLYIKIKREETLHLLNRLLKVPRDIANLSMQILSRELEKNDFYILKNAYIKLCDTLDEELDNYDLGESYSDLYKSIFFQHFLDLSLKDEKIAIDMLDFIPQGIESAFENDIIKSTEDFMKAIIDLGYQSKVKEINNYFKGLTDSVYKNLDKVYEIIFNMLNNRDDQFKFFNIISDEKESRIGKSNYGKILKEIYSSTELSLSEKVVFDKIKLITEELEKENIEKNK